MRAVTARLRRIDKEDQGLSATQETLRYSGDTDLERQTAFHTDAAARAADGWTVQSQITEWAFGRTGVDLSVTYTRDAPADQPVATAAPPMPPTFVPPALQPSVAPNPGWAQGPAPTWGQPQLGPPPPNPAARSTLAAFAMTSGTQEPRGARWLRRLLVFATPVLFLIGAVLNGPNGDNGKPTPAQYPGLALLSLLMGLFVAGLGWYLARWRLLPVFLRGIGVAVLLAIALLFLVVSIEYAMGWPA
jgi:hypothetical protein